MFVSGVNVEGDVEGDVGHGHRRGGGATRACLDPPAAHMCAPGPQRGQLERSPASGGQPAGSESEGHQLAGCLMLPLMPPLMPDPPTVPAWVWSGLQGDAAGLA